MNNKEHPDDDGDDGQRTKRFLLIGETGVGKTHTVNVLCGTDYVVSDSAIGTTFEFQKAHCRNIGRDDIELIDTIGLSEGDAGRVHPAVAFAKLVAFARDSGQGFNGIILVVGSPKVTKSMQENYRLFVETITNKKLPCYLFINKQEFEDYKNQYQKNHDLYQSAGFNFECGFAGGCKIEAVREHTIDEFERCFDMAPGKAERLYEPQGFLQFIRTLWRNVRDFFARLFGEAYGTPDLEDESLVGIFVRLGVPEHIARSVALKINAYGVSDELIKQLEAHLAQGSFKK